MRRAGAFVLAAAALALAACGGEPRLAVDGAWARAVLDNGSVYLTLRNSGGAADTLLSVSCEEAAAAEAHRSFNRDGVMGMEPAGELAIGAGEDLDFKPLGLHVMLMGLKRRYKPGEALHLRLNFKRSGALPFQAEVRKP